MEAVASAGIIATLISTVMGIVNGIRGLFKRKKKKPKISHSYNKNTSNRSNTSTRVRAGSINVNTVYVGTDHNNCNDIDCRTQDLVTNTCHQPGNRDPPTIELIA